MDYEKKYKEALEWARKVMQGEVGFVLDEVLEKFPELKESKDEKIKKDLYAFLDDVWHLGKDADFDKWGKADCSDWMEWVEKQGEEKPSEEYNITGIGSKHAEGKLGEMIKNLKPVNEVLEQKPTWSEEDEERYLSCLKRLGTGDIRQPETINTVWLKSLKDRIK